MSDSCVLAVEQRQCSSGDPEYGDKLLLDGSGGLYTDACLVVEADWEETGDSVLGQSSTKGGAFTYHSFLIQVRDKKVLLCMCFFFLKQEEEEMKMAKDKTHFLRAGDQETD